MGLRIIELYLAFRLEAFWIRRENRVWGSGSRV